MIRVGIYGGSGYTGQELLRLLIGHPGAKVVAATSRRFAGVPVADVYPVFSGRTSSRLHRYLPRGDGRPCRSRLSGPSPWSFHGSGAAVSEGRQKSHRSQRGFSHPGCGFLRGVVRPAYRRRDDPGGRVRSARALSGPDPDEPAGRQSRLLSHEHHPGAGPRPAGRAG